MTKTKAESKTLPAAEVEGAAPPAAPDRQAADIIADAEKRAAELISEAEAKIAEISKIGAIEAAKTIEDAKNEAAEIVKSATEKLDFSDEAYEDAENDAQSIVEQAQAKAAKIIADAEDNAEDIRAEKARVAEVEAKAKATEEATKTREANKKKRAKAKEKALKKPQAIAEDYMQAATLLAADLGDMPTDISALQAHLVEHHGAEFDGDAPIHTVKIYGLIAAGPAGFHNALKNWAAAVRRCAKDAA